MGLVLATVMSFRDLTTLTFLGVALTLPSFCSCVRPDDNCVRSAEKPVSMYLFDVTVVEQDAAVKRDASDLKDMVVVGRAV